MCLPVAAMAAPLQATVPIADAVEVHDRRARQPPGPNRHKLTESSYADRSSGTSLTMILSDASDEDGLTRSQTATIR